MESIVHFENEKYAGRTNFSKDLLPSAIAIAVSNVEGVTRAKGLIVKKAGYQAVVLEVNLVATPGYSAADISYRVQEAVLGSAQYRVLLDKKIKRIDVKFCGVEPKKGQAISEEINGDN